MHQAERYWRKLGPGLITGAADDDPSGIATYSQAGARHGFQFLWLAGFTFPLMAFIQEMCARIGLVTGHGLAANIRRHYPRWVLFTTTALLFTANAINIGADLGAMAKATELILPEINFNFLLIFFALISLFLEILIKYERYSQFLKFLTISLLAYAASAIMTNLNWGEVVARAFIPSLTFSKEQIILICGVLGTTISPYLFFWQTSQEVEEEHLEHHLRSHSWHQNISDDEVHRVRIDIWSGMFFSNLVMFFIIAASAGTLFAAGITNINTASDAALALKPLAGDFAFILFAVGIIGSGLLAIPVLAGAASYAISESFGWKYGLFRKLKEARAFYGVIIAAMIIGLAMNFIGLDPMKALLYSAVANGIIAPIVLVLIVRMSSDKEIMKEKTNHPAVSSFGWLTVLIMAVASVATIFSLIFW